MGQVLLLTSAFLLAFIFALPGFCQGPPEKRWEFRGRGMGPGPMHSPMEDWAGRLNLTEEQSGRVQELREAFLRDTLQWRNDLVVKRFDLRDLMRNPQADSNTILAKQREVSELESKIQERMILFQLDVRKILTPEQIQLLPPGGWMGGGGMMRGRFR